VHRQHIIFASLMWIIRLGLAGSARRDHNMFRILGEGEPETLIDPHRLHKDHAAAVLTSTVPLTQRGNTLNPLPAPHKETAPSSPERDTITAYQQFDSPSRQLGALRAVVSDEPLLPQTLQKQLVTLEHQMARGEDEVSQLRHQYMLATRDAAGSNAQLQSLMETVHGLQQSAAVLQVRYLMSCSCNTYPF
jgi:hypothetical protein